MIQISVETVVQAATLVTGLGLGLLWGWHWRDGGARREVIELERRYAVDLGKQRRNQR